MAADIMRAELMGDEVCLWRGEGELRATAAFASGACQLPAACCRSACSVPLTPSRFPSLLLVSLHFSSPRMR